MCPCCKHSSPASSSVSILHEHCAHNNYTAVCELLKSGHNVNSILYPSYSTPLHIAALAGCKETVLTLLSHGAVPDICDSEGRNAFHRVRNIQAVQGNHIEIAKILIEYSAVACECQNCQGVLEAIMMEGDDDEEMDFEKELEKLRPILQGKLVNRFGEIIDINK